MTLARLDFCQDITKQEVDKLLPVSLINFYQQRQGFEGFGLFGLLKTHPAFICGCIPTENKLLKMFHCFIFSYCQGYFHVEGQKEAIEPTRCIYWGERKHPVINGG